MIHVILQLLGVFQIFVNYTLFCHKFDKQQFEACTCRIINCEFVLCAFKKILRTGFKQKTITRHSSLNKWPKEREQAACQLTTKKKKKQSVKTTTKTTTWRICAAKHTFKAPQMRKKSSMHANRIKQRN